ncbi:hypothetical protein KCU61_g409, partial [Aureobasidium melanogenum]
MILHDTGYWPCACGLQTIDNARHRLDSMTYVRWPRTVWIEKPPQSTSDAWLLSEHGIGCRMHELHCPNGQTLLPWMAYWNLDP